MSLSVWLIFFKYLNVYFRLSISLLSLLCYWNKIFLRMQSWVNVFKNDRVSYDWYIGMSASAESLVSVCLSSWCPCNSLAMIGGTMGWGSALLRTVPVCQISSLHSALLGAAGPKLTTESTDKTTQHPVMPE